MPLASAFGVLQLSVLCSCRVAVINFVGMPAVYAAHYCTRWLRNERKVR